MLGKLRIAFSSFEVMVSYWLVVFTKVAVGVSPWLTWRFGLRTLLIATTLVAVALGLVVITNR